MQTIHNSGDRLIVKILLLVFAYSFCSCTIVPDSENTKKKGEKLEIYFVSDKFNPDEYANSVWKEKVIPLFKQKSLAIEEIIQTFRTNPQVAGEKFGYREKAEGSPWNFRVKGRGVVVAANTETRAATIDIDLLPSDGIADLVIQIGPVFKDSAIRDSLDFISFTDFTNQLEFGRLSNAFNGIVNKDVVSGLNRENLTGTKLSFWGAFTQLQDPDLIRVTPVILEIE